MRRYKALARTRQTVIWRSVSNFSQSSVPGSDGNHSLMIRRVCREDCQGAHSLTRLNEGQVQGGGRDSESSLERMPFPKHSFANSEKTIAVPRTALPWRVFAYFLHEQKVWPPAGMTRLDPRRSCGRAGARCAPLRRIRLRFLTSTAPEFTYIFRILRIQFTNQAQLFCIFLLYEVGEKLLTEC